MVIFVWRLLKAVTLRRLLRRSPEGRHRTSKNHPDRSIEWLYTFVHQGVSVIA